MLLLLFQTYI